MPAAHPRPTASPDVAPTGSTPPIVAVAPVAIVGAGAAGLAAALDLSRSGIVVDVVEKSRGPGGRTATRRRPDGAAYDFGATSFTLDDVDSDVWRALFKVPGLEEALVRVDGNVWVSTDGGAPQPGAPERQRARWTLQGGMNRLAHRLLAASGARLLAQTRVVRVEAEAGAWTLVSQDGRRLGPYRAVVLTPPAPQSAQFFEDASDDAAPGTATNVQGAAVRALRDALEGVTYAPQFALAVGLSASCPRPDGAGAVLVRGGPLSWVSFEEMKAGHVPAGENLPPQGLVVVQATPAWSATRLDVSPDDITTALLDALVRVIGPLPVVAWTDLHRWRYARPLAPLAVPHAACAAGLFVASDADSGVASVPEALRSGLRAAADVRRHIGA